MAGLPLCDEGFELSAFELGALITDDARTGRAVKSCRSVLKEGFLPLIKQCGMELMLVADDRDRLVFNKV